MGQHVSIRSRPRLDALFAPEVTTAAEMAAAYHVPITLAQLTALCFRVKKIRFVGSITYTKFTDDTEDPEETTEEVTETMDFFIWRTNAFDESEIVSELQLAREFFGNASLGSNLVSFLLATGSTTGYGGMGFFPFAGGLFIDETSAYWLNLSVNGHPESGGYSLFERAYLDAVPGQFIIYADFSLLGATLSIPLIASCGPFIEVTAASATLSVEEWFPYATPSGDPFWDTLTGDML